MLKPDTYWWPSDGLKNLLNAFDRIIFSLVIQCFGNKMENGNRLDLTLSLPCGGPSSGSKGKNEAGSEARVEKADKGSKLIDDFKNLLDGANHKEESVAGPQRSNQ
ncbi:hypothetical protein Tco_0350474 [Tanacetum coccineum]